MKLNELDIDILINLIQRELEYYEMKDEEDKSGSDELYIKSLKKMLKKLKKDVDNIL